MSYQIENKPASKNAYFTPAESNNYYKTRYAREGITIHWWGNNEGAGAHDGLVNYFLGQGQAGLKSVNFIVSDNKITQLVDPDNVAWTSQAGNPTTISIECQPTLGEEGYKKLGWLVDQLEKRYGHGLTLYPHKHWYNTACPGTIDLNRIRDWSNKWKNGQGDDDMITKDDAALLRIAHTEVGGWPFNESHAGQYDDRFLGAWQGKSWRELFWAQWNAGGAFRSGRLTSMVAYPNLLQTVEDLKKQLADAQNKPPEVVIKEVEKIIEKCEIPEPSKPALEPQKPNVLAKILLAIFNKKK